VAEWLGLDWGLTGLAVAPDFDADPYLYAFYTERLPSSDAQPVGRPILVRFDASTDAAGEPETIIDDFPQTQVNHQGFRTNGAIHFGPDGTLYLTMGDYDYGKAEGPNGIPTRKTSRSYGQMMRWTSTARR
jgi:glucose/arabinose dehydrogenase